MSHIDITICPLSNLIRSLCLIIFPASNTTTYILHLDRYHCYKIINVHVLFSFSFLWYIFVILSFKPPGRKLLLLVLFEDWCWFFLLRFAVKKYLPLFTVFAPDHLLWYHVSLCLPLTHISCQLINRKAWFRTLSNGLYFIFFMIALCRGCLSTWCMTCSCMVRSLQWNKPRSEVITLSGSVCDRPPFLFSPSPPPSLWSYTCVGHKADHNVNKVCKQT